MSHPLSRARGEVWQDQSEGSNEKSGQLIDDGYLLEDGCRGLKRGQERHMTISYFHGILDEDVWESICKVAAEQS